mmetsp:Transcript_15608/g.40374  ORF Transcript_15608/g.40374 Transcript_15608/m.40374 type:complete len:231 (+) Transcript_15608:1131-1823(+)
MPRAIVTDANIARCSLGIPARVRCSDVACPNTPSAARHVSMIAEMFRTAGSLSTLSISSYADPRMEVSEPRRGACSSFRTVATTSAVEATKIHPQNIMNPPSESMPTSEAADSALRYLLQNSCEYKARKPALETRKPRDWPMVLHVAPSSLLAGDRMVSARPSTAMSCVAARKKNEKKSIVRVPTSTGASALWAPSPNHASMRGADQSSRAPIASCAGTIHVLRRPKRLW